MTDQFLCVRHCFLLQLPEERLALRLPVDALLATIGADQVAKDHTHLHRTFQDVDVTLYTALTLQLAKVLPETGESGTGGT